MNDSEGMGSALDDVASASGNTGPAPRPLPEQASAGGRGRYRAGYLLALLLLAPLLVVLGVAVGAAWGWTSEPPLYRSTGLIYIDASVPSLNDPGGRRVPPMFHGFVRFQVAILESQRAAEIAMETDVWRAALEGREPVPIQAYMNLWEVFYERGTQHVQVQFIHPIAEVATAGVQSLIEAYHRLSAEVMRPEDQKSLDRARVEIDDLTLRIRASSDQIHTLTADYGGVEGMAIRHETAVELEGEAEAELDRVRGFIAIHKATSGPDDGSGTTLEELKVRERLLEARLDFLREKSRKIGETRDRVNRLQTGVEDMRRRLERVKEVAEELQAELFGKGRITILDSGTRPTAPFQDPRRTNAAKGALLGAGIGALLALLLGLLGPLGHLRRARQEVGGPSTPVGD